MLNVLVTGGCGFIGSHLVNQLLKQGHEVIVLDDLSAGSLENLPTDHPHIRFVEGSVLDGELVCQLSRGCDLIFHLASIVGMRLVCREPDLCYDVSKYGARNVLATDSKIPVVLFSSSAVYGLGSRASNGENLEVSLSDALAYDGGAPGYAAGKLELERQGRKAIREGRRVMIIRPFNVIGTGQASAYGMVLPNFIRSSIANLPLTVYDDGNQTRSFSCVRTFVQCLYKLVHIDAAWEPPKNVMNIGSKHIISINELARLVIEQTGSSSEAHYTPFDTVFRNKSDVRHRNPDTTRFEHLLGHVDWPGIPDIIAQMVSAQAGSGQENRRIA